MRLAYAPLNTTGPGSYYQPGQAEVRTHRGPSLVAPCPHLATCCSYPYRKPRSSSYPPHAPMAHGIRREQQLQLEQPGCVHAHMDLLKIAVRLGPWLDGAPPPPLSPVRNRGAPATDRTPRGGGGGVSYGSSPRPYPCLPPPGPRVKGKGQSWSEEAMGRVSPDTSPPPGSTRSAGGHMSKSSQW